MNIHQNITELIGNTPMVALSGLRNKFKLNADIFAKLEGFNPAGSVKDRVALAILDDAEKRGILTNDTVIIEPTSGNTGIGIAAVASARGYRTVIVMPETMSEERRRLVKAYGAELVLTDGSLGMSGAIKKAEELKAEYAHAIIAGQFVNPANPDCHFRTTGPEIWRDTDGTVDVLVAGVGTGGTITGVGRYLKTQNPDIKVIAVEPEASPVISRGISGAHKIQGIGAGFIPETLDVSVIDEVVTVKDADAVAMVGTLIKTDGIFAGISGGAALCGAAEVASRAEFADKNIVVILPDGGEKYLSVISEQ